MKLYIILFLISFNSLAGYVAESKINACNRVVYSESGSCQESENESCFKTPEVEKSFCGVYKFKNIHSTESKDEESCVGQDCFDLLASKTCSVNHSPFINEDYSAVYCREIIGKELIVDQDLYNQKLAEEQEKIELEEALSYNRKLRECGGRVIDLFTHRNRQKSLTTNQVEGLSATFFPIQTLLMNGSLSTALVKIAEVEADGVVITEGDKVALINVIYECNP